VGCANCRLAYQPTIRESWRVLGMADASSRTDTSTVVDMDDKNQRVAPLFSICYMSCSL
jgi:hypothetical protein